MERKFNDKATKDAFYQEMEDDENLLMETIGVALNIAISDPTINVKVADMIVEHYSPLYMAIMVRIGTRKKSDDTLPCCKDLLNE
ncbi:MAG: hypothetical protein CMN32_06440 [Saprospirales bacterium]|jgi:hypothetical protein|nr:hypothetical protein [Saprospirales bacterium]